MTGEASDPSADRPRALITAPVSGPGLDALAGRVDLVIDSWLDQSPLRLYDADALAERLAAEAATICICEADRVAGPVFELPLLAVGSTRGDPTNVDVDAATGAGVPVLHAPGRNRDGVAELTIGLALAVGRRLLAADRDVRDGEVYRDGTIPYQRFRARELAGSTVGIVGLGAVGRAAAWRFEALGATVISADPFAPDATHSLEEVLATADIVSMHAAVTEQTAGMIDADAFATMKDGAIYLNTARAALHDLDALTAALASGHLAGAGLDHFEGELLPEGHPITAMDNVVLSPHIGGATYNTETNHTSMIATDLIRLLDGERPVHVANPEVLP